MTRTAFLILVGAGLALGAWLERHADEVARATAERLAAR